MSKTEAQLDRTDLELRAVDAARSHVRYLDYRPGQDSFKAHLRAYENALCDSIEVQEFHLAHPNYKFG